MIKAVLLDVDNTILDFDKCAEESIKKACADTGISYKKEFMPAFTQVNNALWKRVEDGTLTKNGLHAVRFWQVLDKWGVKANGDELEVKFKVYLKESAQKVDGADDLIRYISGKYVLAVASNSNYKQQVKRLDIAGFTPFIDKFCFSAEIGHEKPSKEFFNACLKELKDFKKEEVIIIGDSINADICGGINAGIKICWFNPKNLAAPDNLKIDYTVKSLEEIKRYL